MFLPQFTVRRVMECIALIAGAIGVICWAFSGNSLRDSTLQSSAIIAGGLAGAGVGLLWKQPLIGALVGEAVGFCLFVAFAIYVVSLLTRH